MWLEPAATCCGTGGPRDAADDDDDELDDEFDDADDDDAALGNPGRGRGTNSELFFVLTTPVPS